MKLFIIFLLFVSVNIFSQEKIFEEKEQEILDYSNIKNVLENDDLTKEVNKKKKFIKKVKAQRKKINREKHNYPNKEDMHALLTELWLIHYAQELKWDFPKPSYGIKEAFAGLLEKLGFYNIKFKLLILNSPNVIHFSLPGHNGEIVFLLSLPFIRNLDLTKVDISLLLLEDFVRHREGMFIDNVDLKDPLLGKNFYGQKVSKEDIKKHIQTYNKTIREVGFNFQQQFEVTKKMDALLKTSAPLWNSYYKLIVKMDRFLKVDLLFKDMLKIYPSPELQLKWLAPPKKAL